MAGASLGSIAVGVGRGSVLWSFGELSGTRTDALVTLFPSAMGGGRGGHRPSPGFWRSS
jgi:hypothetical protein